MKIVLASTSPRRELLAAQLGYEIEIVPPDCSEDLEFRDPDVLVQALAERKALSVMSSELVLSADTVVVAPNGKILGKPLDADDAARMFKALCGHKHKVVTGVCVKFGGHVMTASQTTYVSFKPYVNISYSIEKYIADGKSVGKAGAYGIQDDEIKAITENIEGEVDNVIGLPLTLTKQMIESIISS